jgi:hypothetical protein
VYPEVKSSHQEAARKFCDVTLAHLYSMASNRNSRSRLGNILVTKARVSEKAQHVLWSKLLNAWNISLTENELVQAIQDIYKSWNTLLSWEWIGFGVAMTLVELLRILQLLLTSGSQLNTTVLFEQPALEIQIFSLLVGYGAGYLHGLWQLRKQSASRLAYGDLRPKRLTDYHSLAMQGIPACVIIYNCILFLVRMPYWKGHIMIQAISGAHVLLPSWVAWIVSYVSNVRQTRSQRIQTGKGGTTIGMC